MYITQHVIIESLCGFMVMKRNLIIRLSVSMANQYVSMEFLHGTLRILFASHVHHEDLHRTQDINPVIFSIIWHDSKPATNSLENISFRVLDNTTQELGKSDNSIDSSLLLTSSYLTRIKSVLSRTSATSPNFSSKREKSQLWPEASMDE